MVALSLPFSQPPPPFFGQNNEKKKRERHMGNAHRTADAA